MVCIVFFALSITWLVTSFISLVRSELYPDVAQLIVLGVLLFGSYILKWLTYTRSTEDSLTNMLLLGTILLYSAFFITWASYLWKARAKTTTSA